MFDRYRRRLLRLVQALALWPLACAVQPPALAPQPIGPASGTPAGSAQPAVPTSVGEEAEQAPGVSAEPSAPPHPPAEGSSGALEQAPLPTGFEGRPWLGIEMRSSAQGVLVDAVFPGSAAASGGVLAGDRLLSLQEVGISKPPDVHAALAELRVGSQVSLRVLRGNSEKHLTLTLGAKPDTADLLRDLYVGKPAPSLSTLNAVSGTLVPSLEQLRGKVVVVEFWATWCVACRILAPEFNRWHAELSAQGLRILGVTTEPYTEVTQQLPNLNIEYPIFVDDSTQVSQAYRAMALPTWYVIDQQGIVQEVHVGYAPEAVEQTRQTLRRLLNPKQRAQASSHAPPE